MTNPVRVLVVDDSATMRALISYSLQRDPNLVVIGEARDAHEARRAMRELNPDVVTLDVEMPKMNGLEFLQKIMDLRPTPVVMISNLTQAGAQATIRALEIGAVDCVAKPAPGQHQFSFDTLPEVVRLAARTRLRQVNRATQADLPSAVATGAYRPDGRLIGIGSSTGGVEALLSILQTFPANCAPTLVTQHMPQGFTRSFADRLNRNCKPNVQEATDGEPLEIGRVYLAPGGPLHLEVSGKSGTMRCRLVEGAAVNGHRPSVDVLFHSIARVAGAHAVGAILTGMGSDGAEGLLKMRNAGARTFGQNEATSLVYGMPRVAFSIGAVEAQLPLAKIADAVLSATNASKEGLF
jgi:two-component system chemotaxis response regulator CheB